MYAIIDESSRQLIDFAQPRREQFAMVKKSQIELLEKRGTFAAVIMFMRFAQHSDKLGECRMTKAALVSETQLPRSSAYDGITKLIELGLIRYDASRRVFYFPRNNGVADSGKPERQSGAPERLPLKSDLSIRQTDGSEAKPMLELTNITRGNPANYGRPSKSTKQPGTQLSNPPRRLTENLYRRLPTHLRNLTGVDITDAHRFATATPTRTDDEWITLIDEAWRLRSTLCTDKWPDFNAAKVIHYANNRASYQKKATPSQRPEPVFDHTLDIKEALAQPNEADRRRQLSNLIMFGVSRSELLGHISDADLNVLFPVALNS